MSMTQPVLRQCEQLDRQLEYALRKAGFETDLSKLLPALRDQLPDSAITNAERELARAQPPTPRGSAVSAMARSLGDIPRHLHRHLRRA